MKKNKVVQMMNEDQKVELNAPKNKNKKWLLITGIVVLLLIVGIIIFIVMNSDGVKTSGDKNETEDRLVANGNEIKEDILKVSCEMADKDGNLLNVDFPYMQTPVFGKGDYILCNIKFEIGASYYSKGLSGMTFDFTSEDMELINVLSSSDKLTVKMNENKKDSFVSIKPVNSNDIVSSSEFSKVKLHVYIKNNKSLNGNLENLVLGSSDSNNDYINKKKFDVASGTSRIYKKTENIQDASIIIEKVNNKGEFEKTYEYKCMNGNCHINPASTSFVYENDNKNIVMLEDYNTDLSITKTMMYDLEKGLLGTYGGSSVWLNASNRENNNYIYIKANDTSKFGIIDKNGKVIHDFNLDDMNAVTQVGLIDSIYSVENNMIVDKKNGKYGVVRITSNDKVIDYNYDSIRLFVDERNKTSDSYSPFIKTVSGKYFRAQLNNQWYLYSFDTKDLVFNEGYEYIHVVNDQIVIAIKNKLIYIKDINGNDLIANPVQSLATEYTDFACCGENMGVKIYVNENVINIETYPNTTASAYESRNHYQYNITTKTIAKMTVLAQ